MRDNFFLVRYDSPMYILSRFLKVSLFQIGLFVLLFLWLRSRYGARPWFRVFRRLYPAACVGFLSLFWGYLLVDRRDWFFLAAGDFVILNLSAWIIASAVLLPLILGAWAVRGLALLWRARAPVARTAATETAGEVAGIGRRSFFAKTGILAGYAIDLAPVIGQAGILSGMFLGSREIITATVPMPLPGLHEDLRGLRLVQISDLHVGSLITAAYLDMVLDLLAVTRGDLLVVTGDLIDFHNRSIGDVGRFLNRAHALFPLGVLAITGNHDYFDDGAALKRKLRGGDFRLLLNECVRIRRGRGQIEFVGLDYPWPFYPGKIAQRSERALEYFQAAMAGSRGDDPRILLNHDPAEFHWVRNEARINFTLSGHTHGGQVHVSGPGGGTWIPAGSLQSAYPYISGLYRHEERGLYVNRGLGHSLPLRLDCPPEITVFEPV